MDILLIIGVVLVCLACVGFVVWVLDISDKDKMVPPEEYIFIDELADSYRSLYCSTAEKLDFVSKKKDRATIHIAKLYAEKKQYENMVEVLLHIAKDQQLTRPQILVVRNIHKSLTNLARK